MSELGIVAAILVIASALILLAGRGLAGNPPATKRQWRRYYRRQRADLRRARRH